MSRILKTETYVTHNTFPKDSKFPSSGTFSVQKETRNTSWPEIRRANKPDNQRKAYGVWVRGDDSRIKADSQNQAAPAPRPVAPPVTYGAQPQPRLVACPICFTVVPVGTQFCPQCGSSIPPPTWAPATAPPPKRPLKLIVGIVLLAIVLLGVGGYGLYNSEQILQDAKNSEQNAANLATSQLQPTCFSVRTDSSHLFVTTPGLGYYGYRAVYETFGINNPSRFVMEATWALTLNYPSVGWVLTDSEPFHLSANGTAYPIFHFYITGEQLNKLPPNSNLSTFNVTLAETYVVTGSYATYNLTQSSTYDSLTGSGTGFLASRNTNLQSCNSP